MSEYKHYIRVNDEGIVIHGFSTAFEEPQEGDLQLSGDNGRHFTVQLTTDKGQYVYKIEEGAMVFRSAIELQEEWNARPQDAPSLEDQVTAMQEVINTLLLGGL